MLLIRFVSNVFFFAFISLLYRVKYFKHALQIKSLTVFLEEFFPQAGQGRKTPPTSCAGRVTLSSNFVLLACGLATSFLAAAGLRPRLGILGTSSSFSSTGTSDFSVDCARLLARGFGVLDFDAGPALHPRRGASSSF